MRPGAASWRRTCEKDANFATKNEGDGAGSTGNDLLDMSEIPRASKMLCDRWGLRFLQALKDQERRRRRRKEVRKPPRAVRFGRQGLSKTACQRTLSRSFSIIGGEVSSGAGKTRGAHASVARPAGPSHTPSVTYLLRLRFVISYSRTRALARPRPAATLRQFATDTAR